MSGTGFRVVSYFSVLGVALVVLVTKAQQSFLPGGLATQVGHNSEALLFAILVSAQILVLRAVPRGVARLAGIVVGALALFGLGTWLLGSGLQPSLVTLNEPCIGAGFVLLYLALPRSRATGIATTVVTLMVIVVFFDTAFVLDQAESLVPLVLAGLALDIFDRTILQPDLADRPVLRVVWMGFLLLAAIGFLLAAPWARQDLQGGFRLAMDYGQRAAEAYWGWLIVHLFFSYWLGTRWRTATAQPARTESRAVRG